MTTRTLLFDLSRLDGTGTGPASAVVHLSLARPQQDGQTTITTAPYVLTVDGPTRVEVPVTAPGNALVITWPAFASRTSKTAHLIPEGEGDLVAAELRTVDERTLADTTPPEPYILAEIERLDGRIDSLGPAPTEPAPATAPVVDESRHVLTFQIGA